MQSRNSVGNEFNIGNNPEFFYVGKIAEKGCQFDEFILRSTRKNLQKMQCVILKLQYWGLKETGKVLKVVDLHEKKVEVVQVRLEKIPALRSIKEELNR